jgi:hypothetical protein
MLSSSIPIYNYLMDGLEAYCENLDSSNDIVIAIKAGLKKLELYYEKSDETTMYTITTGKKYKIVKFFYKLNNNIDNFIVLDPRFKLNYYENNK